MKIGIFEPTFLLPAPNSPSHLVMLRDQIACFMELGSEIFVLTEFKHNFKPETMNSKLHLHPLKGKFSQITSGFTSGGSVISHFSGAFSPDALINAVRTFKKIKPDVIFTSGTSFFSVFSAIIRRFTGIPTVHYAFDFMAAWPWWRGDTETMKGYKVHLLYFLKQFAATMIREIPRRDFVHKKGIEGVDFIVTSSEFSRKRFIEFGVNQDRISVVYPGIINRPFHPLQGDNDMSVTYMGHLWQGRGVLDLLRAAPAVIKEFPEVKFIFALSNIHELTENYFIKIIREKGLEANIIKKGVIQDVYSEILNPSRVICLPYRDAPSIKLLESMSAARPVLTTNLGWTPEAIENRKNGIMVDVGDINAISQNLIEIIGDRRFMESLAQNARKTTETKFDIKHNSKILYKILIEAAMGR